MTRRVLAGGCVIEPVRERHGRAAVYDVSDYILRLAVMGFEARAPTHAEMEAMRGVLSLEEAIRRAVPGCANGPASTPSPTRTYGMLGA